MAGAPKVDIAEFVGFVDGVDEADIVDAADAADAEEENAARWTSEAAAYFEAAPLQLWGSRSQRRCAAR